MNQNSINRSVWSEQSVNLILTTLFYIPPALAIVTYRYLRLPYDFTAWIQYVWIFGLFVGGVIGWLNRFPRWVYPYWLTITALILLFSIGHDSDMTWQENLYFKLLVIGPVALVLLLLWLFFRKKYPPRHLISNIKQDWTLVSFAVYGLLSMVVSGIMTNIRSVYGAPFLLTANLVMIAGAIAYLLTANPFRRIFVLGAGMTVTWLVAGLAATTYWHGRQEVWMQRPANGFELSLEYVPYWAAMLALLLLPMLVAVVRRATQKV